MAYRIEWDPDAWQAFQGLPEPTRAQVALLVIELSADPYPPDCVPLEDLADSYRTAAEGYDVYYAVIEGDLYVWALLPGL